MIGPSQDLNTFTGLVVGISAATSTISSIFFGRLDDRVGHRIILVNSMAAAGLLYIPQVAVQAGWQILVLQALVGVAAGGIMPSISALQARFTRPSLEGRSTGWTARLAPGRAPWLPS